MAEATFLSLFPNLHPNRLADIRPHKHRRNICPSSVYVDCGRSNRVCVLFSQNQKHGLNAVASPFIGGTLANPAVRYPDSLGKIYILREYPYLLPCATAGALAFCAFVVGFLGLKEVQYRFIMKENLNSTLFRHCHRPLHARRKPGRALRLNLFYRTRVIPRHRTQLWTRFPRFVPSLSAPCSLHF
jgi:hypothetical protein